jgi:hypothetical protein
MWYFSPFDFGGIIRNTVIDGTVIGLVGSEFFSWIWAGDCGMHGFWLGMINIILFPGFILGFMMSVAVTRFNLSRTTWSRGSDVGDI